jgi:ribosome-associated protein
LEADALKNLVIGALEEIKGQDIVCLNVGHLTSIADYMIVATGTSNRHLKSLADEVNKQAKEAGHPVLGREGEDQQSEWILLDLGDIIVHIMLAATRKLYDLEALWSMSPGRSR